MRRAACRLPLILLCMVLCSAGSAPASTEDASARFESIGDLESIPDGVVTALAQSAAGYLWIGSTRGLIRYDGYGFRRYLHDDSDPHSLGGNLIRALLLASDNRLWVGTDADGLSVFDPRSERFVVYRHVAGDPQSLPPGSVMALAEDRRGAIWIGTRGGGLARLDAASGHVQRFRDGREGELAPRTDFIYALDFDAGGTLWMGTRAGLRRMPGDGAPVEPVRSATGDPSGLGEETIYSLLEPGDGRLWIGTQSGRLLLLDAQTLQISDAPGEAHAAPVAADPQDRIDTVSAMLRLDNGEVWLGRSNGIEVREAGSGRLLRTIRHDPARPTGLAGNEVRELLQDRSGLLWVGGFGGGVQWHDPNNRWARVLRGEPGHGGVFSQPDIASVLERANGEIWLGTRGRGVAILDAGLNLVGGLAPDSTRGEGLGVGWISAMVEDTDAQVWLGSRVGLLRYDPRAGRLQRIGVEQGLQSLNVRRLFLDAAGALWIGTGDGLYRLSADRQRIERLPLADGSPLPGEFNAIAADRDGRVWIGASTGLFRDLPGSGRIERIDDQADPGLSHPSVVGLLVDSHDRLWVDTVDGLFRMREGGPPWAFDPVSARLGVGGDFGANLLEDDVGRIWSQRFVYTPESDALYALSKGDGIDFGTGWFRAYLRTRDGRLLFGGSLGLLEIQPRHFRPWAYQPPLVLTELRIADQLQPATGVDTLRLAPGQRSLAVQFAALDFSAPQRLRYSYRLLGVDDDWVPAAADRRIATYRNLSPGDYRLQIRASQRSGQWSAQEIDLPVQVLPQWWQTRSFVVLAILGSVLLLGWLLRWRLNFLRRQAHALEALVQRRTRELSQAKAGAERALADLELAKDQLVEAEKMASLGALVAGIAHEINTPLGIAVTAASHLRDSARRSSRRLDDGELTKGELRQWQATVEEGNALILGNLERAGRLVSSFKRVAVDQSSEERRHFDLRDFLEEVRTALLPGFRRSGYRLDVDCPAGIELDTFPGALFQIFTNLVNNALIHAFDGRADGAMRIVARRFGNEIELRFSDDGHGMRADIASRAFDPFFTTRRSDGGSGLGLHLVYNLVTQLLRGRIELRTSPGTGCEFVIRLPAVVAAD